MEAAEKYWYVIHTYSGYEDAVARYLWQRVDSLGMREKIFNIVVPKTKRMKMKGGKRYSAEDKVFPGYVLVEMIMDEESWYVVRNTPRVTGFLGAEPTIPAPLTESEAADLLAMADPKEPEFDLGLAVGDLVKVIDGPFKDYDGKISEIDEANAKLKVLVEMFGRETPVELDFLQIKKV